MTKQHSIYSFFLFATGFIGRYSLGHKWGKHSADGFIGAGSQSESSGWDSAAVQGSLCIILHLF